ncbi:hypothetical protein D1872_279170 [compost metagenome]
MSWDGLVIREIKSATLNAEFVRMKLKWIQQVGSKISFYVSNATILKQNLFLKLLKRSMKMVFVILQMK